MQVRKRLSDDATVTAGGSALVRASNRLRRPVESRVSRLQLSSNPVVHSANVLPSRWAATMERSGADVVNIHWVGAGTASIADIGRIRRPVVMTMHDMWSFCGSEHYAPDAADARWRVGYRRGNREPRDRGLDLDRWVWNRKRRRWKPVSLISPSEWLADCAKASSLMVDWPIHVVPNPLDTSVFAPSDRGAARQALNLPRDTKLVLFGALGGVSDQRKGFDLLLDALTSLAGREPVMGLVLGQDGPPDPANLPLPIRWLGHIDDDSSVALAYNAADVVVVPSRQENLPQIGTEAQSTGTPVVAFDTTGLADVVVHKETGYLARPFSTEDLSTGIKWAIEDEDRALRLGDAARQRAVRLWDQAVVARQYVAVFQEAIHDAS
jgi:glycosyltransferase involved in cell wall biosynthesis